MTVLPLGKGEASPAHAAVGAWAQQGPDVVRFVADFTATHGRAPRVLHVGNIANNAYNNAKLLNEAGFDCDVICYDYYHIMGCPEWEDADFTGDVGDQFQPDWTRVGLRGFQRPRWFAQGPQASCLQYLLARRAGDSRASERWWEELALDNQTAGQVWSLRQVYSGAALRLRHLSRTALRYLDTAFRRADAYNLALHKLSLWAHHGGIPARLGRLSLLPAVWAAFLPIRASRRALQWADIWISGLTPLPVGEAEHRESPVKRWTRDFATAFPDRQDTLRRDDYEHYSSAIPAWKQLLGEYDIVQAYSTSGVYCLFADVPYFAFEHGTIREIPYRETSEGRLAALTYRMATHVFVTNFDCLQSAEYLAPGRFTLINHPFDEDHGLRVEGWEAERARLQHELDCDFLFFFPTRHDWVKDTGYADKGNDVFLRAFAALRAAGHRVGMVCCAWGANVAQSRALLESLGCASHVSWGPPLPTVQFERMCRAAHCVVDQFVLGSFGGVLFKAMAVGAPILTYLDEAQLARQFPEMPPVINCRTEAEIVEAVRELLERPEHLAERGAASRRWIQTHHGKAETVRRQAAQFHAWLNRDTTAATASAG